jgi:hypothetical protein
MKSDLADEMEPRKVMCQACSNTPTETRIISMVNIT